MRRTPHRLALAAAVCSLTLGVYAATAPAEDTPASDGTDAVQCANLIYAGTKSSVCFSDQFLSIVARETTIATARKFKPVKLAEEEVFSYPFAIMTGEGPFTLTEAERVSLKRYLEQGGFLLASAGCSSQQWNESFKNEMQAIFPDRSLEPIALDHELFRTVYQIQSLATKGPEATLYGLTIGDKIVMIYSPDGLNDTGTMHGCCCCGGNEIRNAQQVNVNILTYALLQ